MDLPRDEAARLAALRAYDILDTPAEEEFDDLARLASSICGVPIALINLIDVDRLWSKARVGTGLTEMPRSSSVCAHTIQGPDLLIVRDLRTDPRFAAIPWVAGDAGLRFYAGAPLITPGGQALGALCVLDRLPHDLTEDQQDALRSLARQVMTQLELRRTVAELRCTVTAREEAEAELRQREAHFHSLIDNALDLVTVLQGDGTISFQSPSIERLLGYRPQERLGRSFFELTHPDDRHRVSAVFADLVRHPGAVATAELRLRHADGSWRSLEASGRNLLADPHVGGVVVNARDITARKLAEEELRRQHAVTSAITGSLGEGVYALDRAGRLTFMNPAAERMLGWRQEELLGASMHETIHYQHADGTPFAAATCPLLGVLRSGTTVHGEDDVFTRKDGVMIPVAYTSAPIVADGQVTGAVLTFSDITERRGAARGKGGGRAGQRGQKRVSLPHEP